MGQRTETEPKPIVEPILLDTRKALEHLRQHFPRSVVVGMGYLPLTTAKRLTTPAVVEGRSALTKYLQASEELGVAPFSLALIRRPDGMFYIPYPSTGRLPDSDMLIHVILLEPKTPEDCKHIIETLEEAFPYGATDYPSCSTKALVCGGDPNVLCPEKVPIIPPKWELKEEKKRQKEEKEERKEKEEEAMKAPIGRVLQPPSPPPALVEAWEDPEFRAFAAELAGKPDGVKLETFWALFGGHAAETLAKWWKTRQTTPQQVAPAAAQERRCDLVEAIREAYGIRDERRLTQLLTAIEPILMSLDSIQARDFERILEALNRIASAL